MATSLLTPMDQPLSNPVYVVPWKSRKEFLQVYSYLFSEDESLQIKALKRIATWRSRVGTKLSVAIGNTAALLENIIYHNEAVREEQVDERESFLRSGYSLALVRFVNHVTERGQNKPLAQPVHTVASQFGIPDWIVRIRHDATHNALPSLDILTTAAAWAFQYLKEEFWEYQMFESSGQKKPMRQSIGTAFRKLTRQTLHQFHDLRLKHMSTDMEETSKSEMSATELKLREDLKANRFVFVNILLEDGLLIPTAKQLDEHYDVLAEDLMNQQLPCLPPGLREFWDPVLMMLFNTGTITVFAKQAIFSLTEEDELRNHLLSAWLVFLLSYQPRKHTKKMAKERNPVFQARKVLLSVCLDNVNKFTIHFLKYLVDEEELGKEAYGKLTALLRIAPPSIESSQNDALDEDDFEEDEENVYTVADIKEASLNTDDEILSTSEIRNVQASVKDEGISWKICTDVVDWSRVPFGVTPSSLVDLDLAYDDNEEEEEEAVEGEDPPFISEDGDGKDNNSHEDNNDDEDDDENGRAREWKRVLRKRPLEDERSSPKRATYVVNDTELL